MKDGRVKVNPDARRKRILLIPLFLAAVAIGFLLELSTYETLNLAELRAALANLPARWRPARSSPLWKPTLNFSSPDKLDEQYENETKILGNRNEADKAGSIPLWEQPILLNLHNFSWLMNNENICRVNRVGDIRLMPILVHTARSHFQDRLAIRKSFGSLPLYKKWIIRFVFLLGEADRGLHLSRNQDKFEEQEKMLKEEQENFGDLVIGSFIDSYHNLTYKHLMGYKWILNFCSDATFVLKIDDDMFIDIMRWLDWRSEDLEKQELKKVENIPDLYCHTFGGTKPIREKGSKWYASEDDWKDDFYPDYCSGWAYALTVELVRKIYSVSRDIKFFWVDDVFTTGALMEVAKIKYDYEPVVKHIWGNVTTDIKEYRPFCQKQVWDDKRLFRAVCYVPRGDFFERDMMCMWNKTLHDSSYKFSN